MTPCSCARRYTAWAGEQFLDDAKPVMRGWESREGEPDNVQNDLYRGESVRFNTQARNSLVLHLMLATIRQHLPIPPIPLEPSILHDLHSPSALTLERYQHADVVRVADADEAYLAGVLESDERLPRRDGALERVERRVQDVAVQVRRAQVLKRVRERVLDLRLKAIAWVIGDWL